MSSMVVGDDQKNQVLQATDLVGLIQQHLRLTPRGKEFVGLCPFHDDHKPSFYVSPAKQIYKCFSCQAGGNAFSFVMNYHKMTFPEALKFLADRAGIELKPLRRVSGQEEGQGPSPRQRIAEANAKAMRFFQALLRHEQHGRVGREYLGQRRINPEMIEAFALGTTADMWDGLVRMIDKEGWDRQAFEMAGLISSRGPGEGFYDRFRHRLIFPILDALGRPIAFGARRFNEEEEPKYLNSPEHALFNKSATLYGMHLAKKPIIDSRTAVIVEGYTDVIACHQAGIGNVVATLGTALTSQHVSELHRYAEKVVLIFDADEAGQKAADRAVEVFLGGSLDVAVAVLPGEMDPAELLAEPEGFQTWQRVVGQATDALSYQFERLRSRFVQADTLTARQRLIEDYLRRLGEMGLHHQASLRRAMIVQQVARLLDSTPGEINTLLKRLTPSRPAPSTIQGAEATGSGAVSSPALASAESAPKIKALLLAEKQLIACLLRQPQLFHQSMELGINLDEALSSVEVASAEGRRVYAMIQGELAGARTVTLQNVLTELAGRGEQELCNWLTDAEAQLERFDTDDEQQLAQVLLAAARSLLAHRGQQQYQRDRQNQPGNSASAEEAERLQRILEFQRAHPSAARIARLRS